MLYMVFVAKHAESTKYLFEKLDDSDRFHAQPGVLFFKIHPANRHRKCFAGMNATDPCPPFGKYLPQYTIYYIICCSNFVVPCL